MFVFALRQLVLPIDPVVQKISYLCTWKCSPEAFLPVYTYTKYFLIAVYK